MDILCKFAALKQKISDMKELELKNKYYIYRYDELSDEDRMLVDKAKEATFASYAIYSHFKVGAAVLLDDNKTVVRGCNQENASFPLGLCAERTAIFAANAQYPEIGVKTLCIAARNVNDEFVKNPVSPCGACRQVILEEEQRYHHPVKIILVGDPDIYVIDGITPLMPLSFVDADMK